MNIYRVAELAGVSIATVSRVINGSDAVKESTRKRVIAAIQEMNYAPNALAQSLTTKISHMIGLIVPDITNPFYAELARGAQDVADEAGFDVLICNTDGDLNKELHRLQTLRRKRVDGVILSQFELNPKAAEFLADFGMHTVFLNKPLYEGNFDRVDISETGVAGAIKHLVDQGHRDIAHIRGPLDTIPGLNRYDSCQAALINHGLRLNPEFVVEGNFKRDGGYMGMQRLLALDPRPTAIFAANDLMAIGAMEAIQEAGLQIPGDIAMVGYDDIEYAALVRPKLTTVAIPKYNRGQIAVKLLLERIQEGRSDPRIVTLHPRLVVRDSSQ